MKKKTLIIENGSIDGTGTRIDIKGLKYNKNVLITQNFDLQKPIGKTTKIFEKDGCIIAECEFKDDFKGFETGTPAIGFINELSERDENGVNVIKNAKLMNVSICFPYDGDTQ